MARAENTEFIDLFEEFYRDYYRNEIGELAQKYPNDQKSLFVDYQDLYRFDPDLAEDYRNKPDQLQEYAEEALRLFDLPIDVKLGQAHVRMTNLPESTDIRDIRADHRGQLVSIQGIIRKATEVRPKITDAAFECQRCGTLTRIPQSTGDFQEPHECQGCERQGPFRINFDQSEFIDAQKLRVQESPEGLRGGETPQNIDVNIEDDITGHVTAGDHVRVTGVLKLDQRGNDREKSAMFDVYMNGVSVEIEDEEFEEMDIDEDDKKEIVALSEERDIYEQMTDSIAPSIYGYDQEKLAIALQLFSGVTKHLPDESRIRGDLHVLLIGDPGTGKCVKYDTNVQLADGTTRAIGELVEANLNDPKPVDDGVWDHASIPLPTLAPDGSLTTAEATKVWKREAPEHLYRIRTQSGRELDVTPSHPLFVQQDGRPTAMEAENLEEGQFVATPRSVPTAGDDRIEVDHRESQSPNAVRFTAPDTWTPSLARLVGYIVAEGHVVHRADNTADLRITNEDEAVLEDARAAFEALDLPYSEDVREESGVTRLRCHSSEFVSFLEAIEPAILENSAYQRVPERIKQASDSIRRAFLRAYVEGEGHVASAEREITVASMSEALLEDVRGLLTSLGIDASIHERHNESYRLRISGDDFGRYVSKVGFVTDRKQLAAESYEGTTGNTNRDIVPVSGDTLREVREALALTQTDCGVPRTTYQHYERGDRNPSRESLRAVVDAFGERLAWLKDQRDGLAGEDWETIVELRDELGISQQSLADGMDVTQTAISYYERNAVAPDGGETVAASGVVSDRLEEALAVESTVDRLGDLATKDVRWDRISSIETVEPDDEWVYDLEVEGTHSYVSNGVVSHNSQILQYIRHIAPRSVFTSGKGSSSAGLTAAAVRDDFGDGQQWTLEAGALVLADRGIAAVDELDKMRCVSGDTLVRLGNGRISRIQDLAREAAMDGEIESHANGRTIRGVDFEAWTMTGDGRLTKRPVTAIHEYEAPDDLATVTLESGEELTATRDHPFFAFEKGERIEKPAADLEPGDWVYVPRSIPTSVTDGGVVASPASTVPDKGTPSPALAAVLGYLSGDGNVYYDPQGGVYGVRFTNKEEQLLADFERNCREAFEVEPTRPPSEQRDDGVETVRLPGREYADAVVDAGMNLKTYENKAFPDGVTEGSADAKAAFVRALADSEGNVDTSTGNVRISSSSYELLLGTKQLLQEFGVSSQIQTRERTGRRDLYVLAITAADSLAAFARDVGFTLDRKQAALAEICEEVSGDRTILDVIPECGDLLADIRESLRLYQSECGIDDATYCNFENGDANVSIRLSEQILAAFEERTERAATDSETLASDPSWERLTEIKSRYHVSQAEIADGTGYSQQRISREWGESDEVRRIVTNRLFEMVRAVEDTQIEPYRALVRGDVRWRRVDAVESDVPGSQSDTVDLCRGELADLLNCLPTDAVDRAHDLLATKLSTENWSQLQEELDRYGVSHSELARDLGVDQSTVSRWFNGTVETDSFDEVCTAARTRIEAVRDEAERLLAEIEAAQKSKVYDLTVEGTHNFLANGMVVHNSEDRSAMHEALEQQSISISKAGINATLKSRCSLLGAANPKYGRFDQYEPIGEQIDLEPALISRFDLIFTVTDEPDEEADAELAEHILRTNYAGELNTHREQNSTSDYSAEEVANVTDTVAPEIDPELLRKYVAFAKRDCFPTMTEEAKAAIRDFYVELRTKGSGEDAPVPVTARKLEALVRLAEASARVRLSDTVEEEDAERVIGIVRSSLEDIGIDPETGELDADVVETGTSKSQRDRIKNIRGIIADIEEEYDEGAPVDVVIERAEEVGMEASKAEHEIEKLKQQGEVYEPRTDHLRTT